MVAAAILAFAGIEKAGWIAAFVVAPVLIVMVGLATLVMFPDLRSLLADLVSGSKASISKEAAKAEAQA
jgi:hypothetical protein